MLTEAEITGALTDLIGGVILLPLLPILWKKKTKKRDEKKNWLLFFCFLTGGCLLGFLVHYFCRGEWLRWMWLPLYGLLFGTADSFFRVALRLYGWERFPARWLTAATLTVYGLTAGVEIGFRIDLIRVFVGYAAVLGLWSIGLLLRPAFREKKKGAILTLMALLTLLPAGGVQIARNVSVRIIWDFNCNGLAHLFIILAELILFAAAIVSLNEKEGKKERTEA